MKEKLEKIGSHVLVNMGNGMEVECIILDYKNSYGNDRWQVAPVSGKGEAWVQNFKEIKLKK